MPMTTFLNPAEYLEPTSNSVINHELANLRALTGQDWRVQEQEIRWGLFNRKRSKRYILYAHLKGIEYQVINFYMDGTTTTFNTFVSGPVLAAYLYAYQGGLQRAINRLTETHKIPTSGDNNPRRSLDAAINYYFELISKSDVSYPGMQL